MLQNYTNTSNKKNTILKFTNAIISLQFFNFTLQKKMEVNVRISIF